MRLLQATNNARQPDRTIDTTDGSIKVLRSDMVWLERLCQAHGIAWWRANIPLCIDQHQSYVLANHHLADELQT